MFKAGKTSILLAGVATSLAPVGSSLAATPPVLSYVSSTRQSGKPVRGRPANLAYRASFDLKTGDGTQPATISTIQISFPRQVVSNARHFPSCEAPELEGISPVPPSCIRALVGSGSGIAEIGGAGTAPALIDHPAIDIYNGDRGRRLLFVLRTGSPVPLVQRVIAAPFSRNARGDLSATLQMPPDFSSQLGLQIVLTHVDVAFSSRKTMKVKRHRKRQKVSYLQLASCPRSRKLPVKAVLSFNQDDGQPGGPTLMSTATARCS
jgi:hypothetical protein